MQQRICLNDGYAQIASSQPKGATISYSRAHKHLAPSLDTGSSQHASFVPPPGGKRTIYTLLKTKKRSSLATTSRGSAAATVAHPSGHIRNLSNNLPENMPASLSVPYHPEGDDIAASPGGFRVSQPMGNGRGRQTSEGEGLMEVVRVKTEPGIGRVFLLTFFANSLFILQAWSHFQVVCLLNRGLY